MSTHPIIDQIIEIYDFAEARGIEIDIVTLPVETYQQMIAEMRPGDLVGGVPRINMGRIFITVRCANSYMYPVEGSRS